MELVSRFDTATPNLGRFRVAQFLRTYNSSARWPVTFVKKELSPVFRISRHTGLAHIDLSTLRETIEYMKSDADRVPGLEGLTRALNETLKEIDLAERKLQPPKMSPLTAKFLPQRRI